MLSLSSSNVIHPVILTGGSGTRLWPLSRKTFPKQFQTLTPNGSDGEGPDQTLFQATLDRVQGRCFERPLIMTGEDFRFIVQDQLEACGIPPLSILIEPQGRNTAPAVLAAALRLQATDPKAVMLVLPSDHVVKDKDGFQSMIQGALGAAKSGQIVTFGVIPDRPETGYGYLELAKPLGSTPDQAPVPLTGFVEKPDLTTAQAMCASGRHLWNAGVFLCRADTIVAAFKTHAPDMLGAVRAALAGAQSDLGFERLAARPWGQVEDISLDYAILEKVDNLVVQGFTGGWNDLGSWDAIWREVAQNADQVACTGGAAAITCESSLLYRSPDAPQVVGLGLKDTIVVATADAVLVADKSNAQDVKQVVAHLRKDKAEVADHAPRSHRPWGWYETLALGGRFQVKRIVVKPGGILSLQSHHHRAEHWVVVEGTARVTIEDDTKLVSENQSVYVPLGAVHRMENPGKFPMVLIEVQTGAYLQEDDIVRYDDVYNRDDGLMKQALG